MSTIITLNDADLDAVTGGILNGGAGGSGGNGGSGGTAVVVDAAALAIVYKSSVGSGAQNANANGGSGGNGGNGGGVTLKFSFGHH